MKKVFYLVYSMSSGGIERYSVNLCRYLDCSDYQFDFCVKRDRKMFFDDELEELGIRKYAIYYDKSKFKVINLVHTAFRTYKLAKSGYDIAYFNLSKPSSIFGYPLICKIAGIKRTVVHSHNSSQEKEGLVAKVLNCIGRLFINNIADVRLACSGLAAKWMFGNKVFCSRQYVLIKNGIEAEKFRPCNERGDLREKLQISEENIVVGHVGRFEEQKNHRFLLEIFCEILKINKNAVLLLIGVGVLEEQMKDYTEKLGIKSNVIFAGEQNDIPGLMAIMDVFVLPSLFEGLPVVGIEAQAAGLKCVFSDAISREADITGNVTFLGLGESTVKWAETILSMTAYERSDCYEKVCEEGYDIVTTASIISSLLQFKKE